MANKSALKLALTGLAGAGRNHLHRIPSRSSTSASGAMIPAD